LTTCTSRWSSAWLSVPTSRFSYIPDILLFWLNVALYRWKIFSWRNVGLFLSEYLQNSFDRENGCPTSTSLHMSDIRLFCLNIGLVWQNMGLFWQREWQSALTSQGKHAFMVWSFTVYLTSTSPHISDIKLFWQNIGLLGQALRNAASVFDVPWDTWVR